MNKVIIYTPRVLYVLFICFVSLFSLDAFDGKSAWYMQIAGFIIHMIPSFLLMVITIIAWKRELFGALAWMFITALFTFAFHTYRQVLAALLTISGIPFLIGILFVISYIYQRTKRSGA